MEAAQVRSVGIAPLSCGVMVPSTGTNNEIEKKGIPCAGCRCVLKCEWWVAMKSERFNQFTAILDKTEAGASARLWGPIYALQRGPNYPK